MAEENKTINYTLKTGSEPAVTTKNGTNNVIVDWPGSILTTGENAYGIYNLGDLNSTLSSGEVQTEGINAYGIYNLGDKNRTTSSGSITTVGNGATGILTKGRWSRRQLSRYKFQCGNCNEWNTRSRYFDRR